MIRTIYFLAIPLILLANIPSAFAQEVDLSDQREESQTINRVPGCKIDHKGLIINPTPQEISFTGGIVDLSHGFKPAGLVKDYLQQIPQLTYNNKGLKIEATIGESLSEHNIPDKSGAYYLDIAPKGIKIKANNPRGLFYALQTLRQIISGGIDPSQIPAMTIKDYPTINDRGVVEGFYGRPWSHDLRLSLIDFFGRNKLNVYIYGPKNDKYHNCPKWRLPYPEKEAAQIKELINACDRNFVDFVWAIHPGQDYKWNEEDYKLLIDKLQSMYDLGVRRFSVFFDDITGEGTNSLLQAQLLNRITREFVNTHPGVYPLSLCPSDYSELWADPSEDGSLAVYGRELMPEISVMWTGEAVCSDLTPSTIKFINSRTKRPAYFWWNFPVQDYMPEVILQGPAYGLDPNVTASDLTAFVSNPMEHGEASKLALYSVADYAWNPAAYNAIDSWERGIVELVPEASEAYRRFAIHSSDTEMGYRRDESWETPTFTLTRWSDSLASALRDEFSKIEETPAQLRAYAADTMLVSELNPWLDEFAALGTRGRKVIDLANKFRALPDVLDDQQAGKFWLDYTALIMSPSQKDSYSHHKVGTAKLQPFYLQMMNDLANGFYRKLTGQLPKDYTGIGTYENVRTFSSAYMVDNDSVTYFTSRVIQRPGDWVGLDLLQPMNVGEVSILQGRNSRTCINWYDHSILEYSLDGEQWKPLSDEMRPRHHIHWQGDSVEARYVRLRRLDSDRQKYCFIRSFFVNPLRISDLGFGLRADDTDAALAMFDSKPATSYTLTGDVEFDVMPSTRTITILGGKNTAFTLAQKDADDNILASTPVTTPYSIIDILPDAASIALSGTGDVFEIIIGD